jgi:hypothetical protein
LQDTLNDRSASMRVELDQILARESIRFSEEKGETSVERLSRIWITNDPISGTPREDINREHGSPNASGCRSADPNDRDCRSPGA